MNWEQIDDMTQRAKVHGGWLVKSYEHVYHPGHEGDLTGHDWRVAMAFVPDPMYSWKVE